MALDIDFSKIYSPYRLSMFELCPKLYYFYYLDPIYSKMKTSLKKQPQNIWSFNTLGKAVHNAITLFYHQPLEKRTEKNLLEILKETWASEVMWSKKPPLGQWGGFKTVEEERDSYVQAIGMLRNFLKIAELNPMIAYLPTEDFKNSITDYTEMITPLNESVDISGKFDLIVKDKGESLFVIDFKTGKKEEENHFQLKFYKLLAERKFRKPVNRASFLFLRSGFQNEYDLVDKKTKEIEKEVLKKVDLINQTEEFETRPSKLCHYCLYKSFCPDKEKVSEILNETQEEDYSDDLPF